MVALANTFEGGTSGNTITTGGTGSGSAWDNVTIGASATAQWSNAQAAHGTLSGKFATGGSSVASYVAWTTSLGSLARIRFRFYAYLTATPTVVLVGARGLAASVQKFRMGMETDGKLHIRDNGNSNLATSTTTLPLNAWFRVEGDVTSGTSAAYEIRLYTSPDSSTITETLSGTGNFGSTNFDEIRFGEGASFANAPAFWLDDCAVSDSAFLGPAAFFPTGIGAALTLGSLSLADGSLAVTPSGLAVPVTLGGPALSQPMSVGPSGLAVPVALGAPALSQTLTVTPPGLAVPATAGAVVLADGSMVVAPAGQPTPMVLGSPALTDGSMTLHPAGLAAVVAAGTPALADGSLAAAAAGIASQIALGAAALHDGAMAASPVGIASAAALGAPSLTFTAQHGGLVIRPDTGVVTRPDTGLVTRPNTGTVTRP